MTPLASVSSIGELLPWKSMLLLLKLSPALSVKVARVVVDCAAPPKRVADAALRCRCELLS